MTTTRDGSDVAGERQQTTTGAHRVCPVSNAGWLSTPLRRVVHNPARILRGLVAPAQTAIDLGCGPGYFTLPLAGMVGPGGRVHAVDLQPAMLDILSTRAARAGLADRIVLHPCEASSLGLGDLEAAHFALAFAMVHEVPDAALFFREVHGALRAHGQMLLAEPAGHVSASAFAKTVDIAVAAGLRVAARRRIPFSRAALLERY
jgi:ubiquinone/menaquinone biosynthesis C-methylase UbiE